MKKYVIYFCLLALVLTACHKTNADVDSNSVTPTPEEPMVKKYLVKQLMNDDPEKIMLAIDWNDDYSKILHVKYGLGYGSILDYDFKYYDEDSIRVIMSMPPHSYPMWSFWYDSIMIHLHEGKIDSVGCYTNGTLKEQEYYLYNDEDKLIKREYFGGVSDFFEWEGDDVVTYRMYGMYYTDTIKIDTFTQYIHPQYTIPFYLASEVALEVQQPLFNPMWKHQPILHFYKKFEADEDGYVTKMIHVNSTDTLEQCVTFYYGVPNAQNDYYDE